MWDTTRSEEAPSTPDSDQQFLNVLLAAKGEDMAALAWEGFLAGGRGAVMTDLDNGHYLPKKTIIRHFPGLKAIRKRLVHLVNTYRPQTQLVLLIGVNTGRSTRWLLRTWTPPIRPEDALLRLVGTSGCPPMKMVAGECWTPPPPLLLSSCVLPATA